MLAPIMGMAIAPTRRAAVPMCLGGFLTADPGMKATLVSLPRIAASRTSVLVMGETGTGKELVAQAIHMLSPRKQHPLVVQNCAALPEQLLESELFGHRAGAFTDARADKRGLLETASGGTFFLDEIGDVAPAIQAKMLRAIESGQIRRLGDTQVRLIDVRFVAATNKDLEHEVEKGRFRRDLYYRLNVVSLALSPLRERRDDILLLAKFFLARYAVNAGRPALELDDSAHRALAAYAWPGNVRQLENEIERAVAMMGRRNVLTAGLLSPRVTGGDGADFPSTLRDEVRAVERARILSVLERCGWNKTHAARALGGVSRPALLSKMKRLGIPAANPRKPQAEPCASGGPEA
jgi:transcriptional regulator with PAS, ATPase and Fis domain